MTYVIVALREWQGGKLTPKTKSNGTSVVTEMKSRSCIGSGMSIVGNIECNGPAQVFGRIEGGGSKCRCFGVLLVLADLR